jgi:hypothetical protein
MGGVIALDSNRKGLGLQHRPSSNHGREAIPVPDGQVLYDSLKSSFVDFGRLVATLTNEAFSGYVRLTTDDASGLVLFRERSVLECIYRDVSAQMTFGKAGLQLFNDEVAKGSGVLDVIALDPAVVDGIYGLAVFKPMYVELSASWVDMNAFLKFLKDRKLTGSVMIKANAGTGVITLADGVVIAAYTTESRDISDKPDRALALCEDATATVEVKSGDGITRSSLDLEMPLSRAYEPK